MKRSQFMKKLLDGYNYSRQFIFLEDAANTFLQTLETEDGKEQAEDYLWKIVTSVYEKNIDGKTFHMIQYEDKRVGWIKLKNSLRIYRHSAEQYKIVEDIYSNNELNKKLGIEKDFISHFKEKLLTVKSEVMFENERYLSVFIKEKFHGFHHENVLDPLLKCNIDLSEYKSDFELFSQSNLTKPAEDSTSDDLKMTAVFKKNKIGKVLSNNEEYFWISYRDAKPSILKQVEEVPDSTNKSIEKLELDDLLYSVNLERGKTKDILKSVLSAKKYLKDGKTGSIPLEANDDYIEMEDRYNKLKKEYDEFTLEQARKTRKISKELELNLNRLEQQKDYNNRVTEQRNKYKERMNLLDDKMKNLNDKYKVLKDKHNQLRKK